MASPEDKPASSIPEREYLLLKEGDKMGVQRSFSEMDESQLRGQHEKSSKVNKVLFDRSVSVPNPRKETRKLSRVAEVSESALESMRKFSMIQMAAVAPADEDQERGNWDNPIEFFLSCLGYAVGLGNVWRFPFLVYRNGGGAFLIPYIIMLCCCGIPMMLMEMTIGQYSSQGPLSIWSISPLFKGTGVSMIIVSCLCTVYYNLITGWSLYYLFMSLRAHLPWACCDYDTWASEFCLASETACPEQSNNTALFMSKFNESNATSSWTKQVKFSADDYFHRNFLGITEGIESMGGVQWPILLALVIAWLIVFAVLCRGIKTIGKTVYFTSTFPYLVLLILLIRASIEPGAADGIRFYLTPKWERLLEARVWGDAAAQIFYSTGVCFGGTITLASYNKFSNNLYRDALIVGFGNSLTSIFSGFVVFSILGFMAHSLGVSVDEVATSGPGLTFITYPQAVAMLPISPLWSCLFFFMLLTLALSSMFPTTENIVTALIDQFPQQLRPYKFFVTAGLCFALFLCGIPLTMQGGVYLLQLVDTYAVGYTLLFLGLVEVSVVCLRYGGNRVLRDLSQMIGYRPCKGWIVLWCFVTPVLLLFAIIFSIANEQTLTYSTYTYPPWTSAVGWLLVCISLSPIPIFAVIKIVKYKRKTENREKSIWSSIVHLTYSSEKYSNNARKFMNFN